MTRSDDLKRATRETIDRLRARGLWLDGRERVDELVAIDDAVKRFEDIVTSKGGDLMVDEGSPGHLPQPDDPDFGLPTRAPHEPVAAYLERLEKVIEKVRRHPSVE